MEAPELENKIKVTWDNIEEIISETVAIQRENSIKIKKLQTALDTTNMAINGIADSNGAMAEATIYDALENDMTFAGQEFDDIYRNMKKHIKKDGLRGEYDIMMTNGDTIALIETKFKVRKQDVINLYEKQAPVFSKLFPEYSKYKLLLGIGGVIFETDAIEEADAKGVGIIKVVGNKIDYNSSNIKPFLTN